MPILGMGWPGVEGVFMGALGDMLRTMLTFLFRGGDTRTGSAYVTSSCMSLVRRLKKNGQESVRSQQPVKQVDNLQ